VGDQSMRSARERNIQGQTVRVAWVMAKVDTAGNGVTDGNKYSGQKRYRGLPGARNEKLNGHG